MATLLARLLILVGVICAPVIASTTFAQTTDNFACPVTLPNRTPVPEGMEHYLDIDHAFHQNGIWTGIPVNGVQVIASAQQMEDGSGWEKTSWIRGDGVDGHIEIRGERLDTPSDLQPTTDNSEQYGTTGWTILGLVYPSEGCWRVDASAGDATLSFTVEVVYIDADWSSATPEATPVP